MSSATSLVLTATALREVALQRGHSDLSGFLDDGGGVRLPQGVADYLYERTWLSVVVDIVPEWGTKAGFTSPALSGETQEALLSDLEDLQATEEIKRTWRFSRTGGGSLGCSSQSCSAELGPGRPAHGRLCARRSIPM